MDNFVSEFLIIKIIFINFHQIYFLFFTTKQFRLNYDSIVSDNNFFVFRISVILAIDIVPCDCSTINNLVCIEVLIFFQCHNRSDFAVMKSIIKTSDMCGRTLQCSFYCIVDCALTLRNSNMF